MASVCLSLQRAVTNRGDGIASIDHSSQQTLTWNQFDAIVQALASFFVSPFLGSSPVAYLGRNSPEFLLYLYGVSHVGRPIVPFNIRWSAQEITHALNDSSSTLLVIDFEFVQNGLLQRVLGAGVSITDVIIVRHPTHMTRFQGSISPSINIKLHCDVVAEGNKVLQSSSHEHSMMPRQFPINDALHSIIYTSGTTGRSKGVMLTHLNQVCQAQEKCGRCGYNTDTRYLNVAPMFHVGGLSSAIAVTMAGGTHIFMDRFEAQGAINIIQAEQVNTLVVVPAMLGNVVQEALLRQTLLTSVRLILVGGQALETKSLCHALDVCPEARIFQTYACTEACSSISFVKLQRDCTGANEQQNYGKLVGTSAWHSELRIVDENRTPVLPDICGKIQVRGPHIMKGYWKREDLTSQVLHPEGWLETGDLGFINNSGQLFISGRQSDVIKTGGEKVHASEVESALLQIGFVKEAAVIGSPDRKFGEAVTAFVVVELSLAKNHCDLNISNGQSLEHAIASSIKKQSREILSRYKCPRKIFIVETLPRNSSGKVIKSALMIPNQMCVRSGL
mmetsp:Transcript_4849/g.6396  ORF Transcript_4849/g.6396 Transcript_4849/m.6396 type:complete len:561 (-) Transcript_4849:132-1814(-)